MKTVRTATWTTLCSLLTSPALAAQAARQDHSGLLVWAFLGVCALIVVAQAFPAMLMILGMAKALATRKAVQEVHVKR